MRIFLRDVAVRYCARSVDLNLEKMEVIVGAVPLRAYSCVLAAEFLDNHFGRSPFEMSIPRLPCKKGVSAVMEIRSLCCCYRHIRFSSRHTESRAILETQTASSRTSAVLYRLCMVALKVGTIFLIPVQKLTT